MTGTATPCRNVEELALKSLASLPPFSPVLNRLLATLAREDVSFTELSSLIEKDTVLAGNVLRVVNSALYGRSGTINSVSHAIAILGLTKLRNTALSFSVNRLWKGIQTPPSFSTARFNLHSVATGILADQLAQNVEVHYAEGAFAAGLFHDLGKLLIATSFKKEFETIRALSKSSGQMMEECEIEVIGISHPMLTKLALQRWNLPAGIQVAASSAQQPDSVDPKSYANHPISLAHVVHAANRVTNSIGISIEPVEKEISQVEILKECTKALETIGIGGKTEQVLQKFQVDYEALKDFV